MSTTPAPAVTTGALLPVPDSSVAGNGMLYLYPAVLDHPAEPFLAAVMATTMHGPVRLVENFSGDVDGDAIIGSLDAADHARIASTAWDHFAPTTPGPDRDQVTVLADVLLRHFAAVSDLVGLLHTLRGLWGRDGLWTATSSSTPDRWSPEAPATGQADVTALLVADRFGGDVLHDRHTDRWVTRLPDGVVVDLTCSDVPDRTSLVKVVPGDLDLFVWARMRMLRAQLT